LGYRHKKGFGRLLTIEEKWEEVQKHYSSIIFKEKPNAFVVSSLWNELQKFKKYTRELSFNDPKFKEKNGKS